MKSCQPPVADTKTPNTKLPMGACDAHCHVFGPADKFPYAEGRAYTPPNAPLERFQALQATLGFERAVIVQAACHGTDNAVTLDAIQRSGDAFRGVALIDDGFSDKDLEDLHEGGIRGIRFSFARHLAGPPDFDRVRRLVERIKPLDWHLVLYLEPEDIIDFADTLTGFGVPLLIDHMGRCKTRDGVGQKAFQILLDFIRGEDFWVKICGAERNSDQPPDLADSIPFARALIEANSNRVLWGTDWPHPNIEGYMPNDGDLVDLFAQYAPDEAMRKKILVDNPAGLYGF